MVEGYGFDVLSMYSDLTYQPPIIPLTLAAQATTSIQLGPASLNPYTLHPVEIAGQIATLDMVSRGRAYLGLSRGAWLDAIDVEQPRPINRVVDTLRAVNHLLSGETAGFRGATFALQPEVTLRYRPERTKIPMLLGSWGPRMLAAAGPLVDEVKLGGSANPAMMPVARARLNGASSGIVAGAVTIVDEDGAAAHTRIKQAMALYLPVVAPLDPTVAVDPELLKRVDGLARAGQVADAARLIGDDLIKPFAFAGTPGEIVDQCAELFAAGATRIEFGTPHGLTTATGLRLLGEQVLPALRSVV